MHEYLANRSLWLDESLLALELIGKRSSELGGALAFGQGAPVGFLLAEKALAEIFGYSELALRFVPLVAGLLALVVFVSLARRVVAPDAVLLAVVLVAVADGLVYYSAEAKQYSTDVFVTVCLLAAAAPLARGTVTSMALAFAFAGVALVWLSHAGVLVATACGIVIVAAALASRSWSRLLRVTPVVLAWAVSCLAFVAAAPNYDELRELQSRGSGVFVSQSDSIDDPSWVNSVGAGVAGALGLPGGGALSLVTKSLGAVAFVGLLALVRRDAIWAALLSLPVAITLAVSAFGLYPLFSRTLLFLAPIAALLVAEGAVDIARRIGGRHRALVIATLTVLIAAVPITKAIGRFVDRPEGQELRPALAYVRDHWEPGDVLYVGWADQHVYLYYLRCGCFELGGVGGTRLPSDVVTLEGSASENYAAFVSATPTLVVGRFYPTLEARLDDLDRLRGRGRGRVWVVSSGLFPGETVQYREEALPRRLDRLGRRIDAFLGDGSRAYLYDLDA